MEKFTKFIKSPSAPIFALGAMMLAFLTLYSKMYLGIIPTHYKIHPIIDIGTALIVGLGLCTITFIIIVHSKNKSMPMFFALGDFFGGILFYAKDFELYYTNSDYISIGQGVFFAVMKSAVLFYCADIFIKEVEQKEKATEQENAQIQSLQDRINTLLKDIQNKDKALQDAYSESKDLKTAISSLNSDLSEKEQALSNQVQSLKSELQSTKNKFDSFKNEAMVWKLTYLKKEQSDIKKRSKTPENDKLIEDYETEIQQLTEILN